MNQHSMLLVGCGNMGRAMLEGWLAQKILTANNIYIVEPNSDLHAKPQALGCCVVRDLAQLPTSLNPNFILFAIKPQSFETVVPAYKAFASTSTFISVVAGITSAKFENVLSNECALIRVMPNTPAAIGEGMLAFCDNGHVLSQNLSFIEKLLSVSGEVVRVSEGQMDAVTAVSGSGPAYVFYMIECLARAGIDVGLEPEIALTLARQTVKGAGILAATADTAPDILRQQVTSPNGTTAAGLEVLMNQEKMQSMIRDCVRAARDRSIELGR